MWAIIKSFLMTNWLKVLEIAGVVIGVFAIFRSGQKSEQVGELKTRLKETEKAHGIENANSALSDSSVDSKLRSDWSK